MGQWDGSEVQPILSDHLFLLGPIIVEWNLLDGVDVLLFAVWIDGPSDSIQEGTVNWDFVKERPEGDETEDAILESNARYCISLARKLGATVFLTWEDIVEVWLLFSFWRAF